MSNMQFLKEGSEDFLNHIKQQQEYSFIQKPEIVLVEESGEIKARLNNWNSGDYTYSLTEIGLLLEMLQTAKDTIFQLTQENQLDAQRSIPSTGKNSSEPSSKL